jgi:uncharacterized protein (TIGR03083 family)
MVPERDVDPAALYRAERQAFASFLRERTAAEIATVVPATPAWNVHDVLAHVVGIAADLNAQRFDPDSDAWTDEQTRSRRLHSIDDLVAEWDREGPPFESGLRVFGYQFGAHFLADLVQHVSDVHAALGRPPARDDLAIGVALDFLLASFEETLEQNHAGAVEVHVDGEHWRLGAGPVRASVTAARFELFRTLGGRRTLTEVCALSWTGDVDAIVGLVSRYPPPTHTLPEPR